MTAMAATITTTTVASQATKPIDELEEEPRRDGEDDDREGLDEERGAGLLCLHTPRISRATRRAGAGRMASVATASCCVRCACRWARASR